MEEAIISCVSPYLSTSLLRQFVLGGGGLLVPVLVSGAAGVL